MTGALVLSFLGGSAVGAIGAAGVTAWHNSTERLREELTAAAEHFLGLAESARDALWQKSLGATEFLDAKNSLESQSQQAKREVDDLLDEWNRSDEGAPQPDVYMRAVEVSQRLIDAADGLANPRNRAQYEEAEEALLEARQVAREVLSVQARDDVRRLVPIFRSTIRGATRFVTAIRASGETGNDAFVAISAVHAAVARVGLVYPRGDGSSEAASRAEIVKQRLLEILTAIDAAVQTDAKSIEDQRVTSCFQALTDAVNEFAASANAEIRKTRWWWR